jgi:hypothetical protein
MTLEPVSYRGHNLLNVMGQTANKMGLYKKELACENICTKALRRQLMLRRNAENDPNLQSPQRPQITVPYFI